MWICANYTAKYNYCMQHPVLSITVYAYQNANGIVHGAVTRYDFGVYSDFKSLLTSILF